METSETGVNKKYTADELIYQVYKEICATGDITIETSIQITQYIMDKHDKS